MNIKLIALLSTTILPLDGTYSVRTLELNETTLLMEANQNVAHYVGHPATKAIVEQMGAVPATSKLFTGLEAGESALAFAIAQGKSDRSQGGTTMHQDVTFNDLTVRIITRLE